jgi:hypothetical protein
MLPGSLGYTRPPAPRSVAWLLLTVMLLVMFMVSRAINRNWSRFPFFPIPRIISIFINYFILPCLFGRTLVNHYRVVRPPNIGAEVPIVNIRKFAYMKSKKTKQHSAGIYERTRMKVVLHHSHMTYRLRPTSSFLVHRK